MSLIKEIEEYEKILREQPDNFFIRKLLAETYFNAGLIDKALIQYYKLAQLSPLDADLHHFMGICYYELGLLDKAEQEYEEALRLSKYNDAYYNNLGVIYTEKNLLSDAIKCYNNALKLNENNSFALSNLGVTYTNLKMEDKAKEAFYKALKMDPNQLIPHYCLGMEYEKKGELHIGEIVRIGELLQLLKPTSMQLKNYSKVYKTKIEDMTDEELVIGAPIHHGVVIPIRRGTRLIIGIPRPDALYGFQSEVIERKMKPFPTLILKRVEKVKRIQRRKFVRIDVHIPCEIKVVKLPEQVDEYIKIIKGDIREKNISAGGMLIVSKKLLPPDTILEIKMDIQDYKIKTLAKVVRVKRDPETAQYEIGTEYLDIKEKDRDRITQYIYAREIDLKKKGF